MFGIVLASIALGVDLGQAINHWSSCPQCRGRDLWKIMLDIPHVLTAVEA